jgi:hypothetical protein
MRPAYGEGIVMIAELLLGLIVFVVPASLFGPTHPGTWASAVSFCVAVEAGASEAAALMISTVVASAIYMLGVYLPWALEIERLHRVDGHGHRDQGDEDGPRHLRRVP